MPIDNYIKWCFLTGEAKMKADYQLGDCCRSSSEKKMVAWSRLVAVETVRNNQIWNIFGGKNHLVLQMVCMWDMSLRRNPE